MKKNFIVILINLFLFFPFGIASADEISTESSRSAIAEASLPDPSVVVSQTEAAPQEKIDSENEEERTPADMGVEEEMEDEAHAIEIGTFWIVPKEYFEKAFEEEPLEEPSGLRAKINENLSGTIQTRWGPVNTTMGYLTDFLASSPVLLDRTYNVRKNMLYK